MKKAWKVFLLLVVFITTFGTTMCNKVSNSNDTDSETNGDTDSDTGKDSDSDTNVDTDTGTGTDECEAVPGIKGWGGPCANNSDCPPNSMCFLMQKMVGASESLGICGVMCCTLRTPDTDYCTDISGGTEICNATVSDQNGQTIGFACIIRCKKDAECPDGTACLENQNGAKFCYPPGELPDAGPDSGMNAG